MPDADLWGGVRTSGMHVRLWSDMQDLDQVLQGNPTRSQALISKALTVHQLKRHQARPTYSPNSDSLSSASFYAAECSEAAPVSCISTHTTDL